MLIKWLHTKDVDDARLLMTSQGYCVDSAHIALLLKHYNHLCFGAYIDEVLVGVVCGVSMQQIAFIKYLSARDDAQPIAFKLLEQVFSVLRGNYSTIYTQVLPKYAHYFEALHFTYVSPIISYENSKNSQEIVVPTDISKALEMQNFFDIAQKVAAHTFNEPYIFEKKEFFMQKSALNLALEQAFSHSHVIHKASIYVGPWYDQTKKEGISELLLRKLLFHRQARTIKAHALACNQKACALYEEYAFSHKPYGFFMGYNTKPVAVENIYSLCL